MFRSTLSQHWSDPSEAPDRIERITAGVSRLVRKPVVVLVKNNDNAIVYFAEGRDPHVKLTPMWLTLEEAKKARDNQDAVRKGRKPPHAVVGDSGLSALSTFETLICGASTQPTAQSASGVYVVTLAVGGGLKRELRLRKDVHGHYAITTSIAGVRARLDLIYAHMSATVTTHPSPERLTLYGISIAAPHHEVREDVEVEGASDVFSRLLRT